jgi:Protein of unknown function (DUF3313)
MKYMNHKYLAGLGLVAFVLFAASFSVQSNPPEVSFDGLHLESTDKVAILYTKPNADFSVYTKFMMLDTYVAFRKNWQRDTKVAGRRVSKRDMQEIKVEVAELFHETFKQQMEADDGYPLVAESDEDVLLIRPAIIDLDVTAPDIKVAGRHRSYVASAGAATLYLELYDSISGEILARVIDRRSARDYGYMQWSSSVTNRNEAKKMFRRWADLLREGLDQFHGDSVDSAK